ncbi:unnamed protein product [Eretmochelys imbricata]
MVILAGGSSVHGEPAGGLGYTENGHGQRQAGQGAVPGKATHPGDAAVLTAPRMKGEGFRRHSPGLHFPGSPTQLARSAVRTTPGAVVKPARPKPAPQTQPGR